MADDIVDQLRHEAAQCSASPCIGCTNLLAAADEIERLRGLGDAMASMMRSGSDSGWDDAIDAWQEGRRG